jgi:hypothetical protein
VLLGMTENADAFFAFTVLLVVFGGPLLAWTYFRMLAHRERMEMIQHGLDPGPLGRAREWRAARAEHTAPRGAAPTDNGDAAYAQSALRKGLVIASVGLALTIGLSFIGLYDGPGGTYFHPGPWLIGGLIPLFVGLAQIMIAVLSGAQLHFGPRPYQPTSIGSPTPPPTGSPTPTYEGSYTYRPGGTQELRPPTPPPATHDN